MAYITTTSPHWKKELVTRLRALLRRIYATKFHLFSKEIMPLLKQCLEARQLISQPGDSIKKRDHFRMCQVNQQCRTTMHLKRVARGNWHCPEKEMAIYDTANLIAILQQHLCGRKTIQALVNISREQSCWKMAFSEINVFTVISAFPWKFSIIFLLLKIWKDLKWKIFNSWKRIFHFPMQPVNFHGISQQKQTFCHSRQHFPGRRERRRGNIIFDKVYWLAELFNK